MMYVTMHSTSWRRNSYTRMKRQDNQVCIRISPTHRILSSCHSSPISVVSHYGPTRPVSTVNHPIPCNNDRSTKTHTTSTPSAWQSTPVSTPPHHPSQPKTITLKSSKPYVAPFP